MPDVQEVFRLATNKVKPDPDALERQHRRQRATARKSRVRAYLAVAAVIVVARGRRVRDLQSRTTATTTRRRAGSTPPDGPDVPPRRFPPARTRRRRRSSIFGGSRRDGRRGCRVDAFAPSVSADGIHDRVRRGAERAGLQPDRRRCGADGSEPHFITTPHVIVDGTVAISPDANSKVAFEGDDDGNSDIYVVERRRDGSATADHRSGDGPVPAMVARREDDRLRQRRRARGHEDPQFSKTAEIFTVPADGGAPTRLTHNSWSDAAPSYSPDGKTIVDQSVHGLLDDGSGRQQRAEVPDRRRRRSRLDGRRTERRSRSPTTRTCRRSPDGAARRRVRRTSGRDRRGRRRRDRQGHEAHERGHGDGPQHPAVAGQRHIC